MRKPIGRRLRQLARRANLPPRPTWPYALPLLPALAEAWWRVRLRRTPAITAAEHAARTGVGDIEELIACPVCGEPRFQHLFSPTRPGRWTYHVVRCRACGFLYRQPGIKPERLGDLYSGGNYARFLSGHYGGKRKRRYRHVMDCFEPVFDEGAGRRILDYGCGVGYFLDVAHERGFEPYGVDLSPDAIEVARSKPSGANAYLGAPTDVPEIAAGGFDVVTLWSVLAHLPRPVEDLAMLRSLLADDGVMLVLTVNANSLLLKRDGGRWNGFTPNHLVFFSPTTLALALRQARFGALVLPPWYGEGFERGKTKMSPSYARRHRRNIERGNRGNMLRGLAFADADGPARWGLSDHVVRLG
jgi:SAM-dependent methyltransferase